MSSRLSYSAPAKVILFGEHAVVYGKPAIAVPVSSLRATASYTPNEEGLRINALDLNAVLPVDIDSDMVDNALVITARLLLAHLNAPPPKVTITLSSTIPMASGLGSGAAVSTALARALLGALGASFSIEDLNQLIYEIEKLHHGTPSGIDNTVIVYEKPVYFVRGQDLETLNIGQPFTLVIGDTGEAALTRVAVGDVRQLVEGDPVRMQPILDAIQHISERARRAIEQGDVASLGPLMDENHDYLQQLTVSSPGLDTLVAAARSAGAWGAKLSGGGRGGNMIALASAERAEAVQEALLRAGAVRAFITIVGA
ncbi:MAG: mevalonate kinase [Anaerolineae bacterium]